MKNGAGLTHHIDEVINQLRELRGAIMNQDRDSIEAVLEVTTKEYEAWYNRRHSNRWQDDEQFDSQSPGVGSMMGNMMGGFFGNFRIGDKNDDKDD